MVTGKMAVPSKVTKYKDKVFAEATKLNASCRRGRKQQSELSADCAGLLSQRRVLRCNWDIELAAVKK